LARAGRTDEHLKERVCDSLQQHLKNTDRHVLSKLLGLLRYVGGDYQEPATFNRLREAIGMASRPAHYVAIPPSLLRVWLSP